MSLSLLSGKNDINVRVAFCGSECFAIKKNLEFFWGGKKNNSFYRVKVRVHFFFHFRFRIPPPLPSSCTDNFVFDCFLSWERGGGGGGSILLLMEVVSQIFKSFYVVHQDEFFDFFNVIFSINCCNLRTLCRIFWHTWAL